MLSICFLDTNILLFTNIWIYFKKCKPISRVLYFIAETSIINLG